MVDALPLALASVGVAGELSLEDQLSMIQLMADLDRSILDLEDEESFDELINKQKELISDLDEFFESLENEESSLTVRNQTLHLTAQQEESSTLTDHPFGSKVPISAIPRDGYYFDTWLGEGVSDPSAKNTFAVMTEDRNITALFKPHSFNLEVELTFGGEILGEGTYLFEETAELVAIEKSGYKFEGWYDQGIQISDEASFELIIKEDISLIAKFISTFHKVELDASLGGQVLGGGSFAEGTEIHIQALPDDGFIFDYWEGVPDSLSQLPSGAIDCC